jgi:hypothetical protein
MLDRLASRPHGVRIGIEPSLDLIDHMFMLPACDAALLGRRTLAFDRAALASRRRPVTAQRHPMLDVGVMIGQKLPDGHIFVILDWRSPLAPPHNNGDGT